MDITITIPDEKAQRVKEVLLKWHPKPADFEGTDWEWIEQSIKNLLRARFIKGKEKLGELDPTIPIDVSIS